MQSENEEFFFMQILKQNPIMLMNCIELLMCKLFIYKRDVREKLIKVL